MTLLWVEEGVADFFEVYCQQAGSGQETKVQVCKQLFFGFCSLALKLRLGLASFWFGVWFVCEVQ